MLHFSRKVRSSLLYSLICVVILVLRSEKKHEERHRLTYYLWIKMKYLVLETKVENLTMEMIL
jgi:hypothetical protein